VSITKQNIMEKKKIQLKELQVKSFITSLSEDEAQEIRGGVLTRPSNNNGLITPNLGRKLMWTISEQRKDSITFGQTGSGEAHIEK
jgi:hypothetical protein